MGWKMKIGEERWQKASGRREIAYNLHSKDLSQSDQMPPVEILCLGAGTDWKRTFRFAAHSASLHYTAKPVVGSTNDGCGIL